MREQFVIPDGVIYLGGNSLGLIPSAVPGRLAESEWSHGLIRSWSTAGWFDLPLSVGNRIGPIIGAGTNEIAVGESTSVNLFRAHNRTFSLPMARRQRTRSRLTAGSGLGRRLRTSSGESTRQQF